MNPVGVSLDQLPVYLSHTLSTINEERKAAEKCLEQLELHETYGLLLLQLIGSSTQEATVKLSAAINFKNFIKRNWRIVDDVSKISEADRLHVKQNIINLMLTAPEQIQRLLSDAISIIGREDFPYKWPNLITEMVEKFSSGDFNVINGILHTAHSLFKRYRYEFRSNELWTEIKYVLDKFALPLTELFKLLMNLVGEHAQNKEYLRNIFGSLHQIAKIFYSLNCQDLPEFFEDNMAIWMTNFLTLLNYENPLLVVDDGEAGVRELTKSQICSNVAMYAQKYDEEFSSHLPAFVEAIWNLLVKTGAEVKYDILACTAIQFLASVSEKDQYRKIFEDNNILSLICEKVVVPNMRLRDEDVELFEDNPEEFIRRDIEGSDIDTRRRAACDLVRGLCKFFEADVFTILGKDIMSLLAQHSKDPLANWKLKDLAIYLVISLASKAGTQKHGITKASDLVDLSDFCIHHISPELRKPEVNTLPVLRASCLKYLFTFRQHLSGDLLRQHIGDISKHLEANSVVLHTYAAHCLERLLTVKLDTSVITPSDMEPHFQALLSNLFAALHKEGSHQNEYIMKCVMRSVSLMQLAVLPFLGDALTLLANKLALVARNPTKPHFNHYLFETLCLLCRVCKAHREQVGILESKLFPVFEYVLQADVSEFIPYVFQVMSILLECHSPDQVPASYSAIFPLLLTPVLWERPAQITPLVRLLQAFTAKTPASFREEPILQGVLGVFQKLIASKTHDHEGFALIGSLMTNLYDDIEKYVKSIFGLLFTRLQKSKTSKFARNMVVFVCQYVLKATANKAQSEIDQIQPGLFGMMLEKVVIADMQKVAGTVERKTVAVATTKILCECQDVLSPAGWFLVAKLLQQGPYNHLWAGLLQALIQMFELPEDDSVGDDEHFIEIEDTPGYQTAYCQLAFASKASVDPLGGTVPDARIYLAQCMHKLGLSQPLGPRVASGLTAEANACLNKYMSVAGTHL